ncbi:MAG: VWA domain-containing protein [Bifidobacteriaceae bacterium]|jgi:Ca-activated chloride channel family protein|nr:VWA domain-containing protein [Bifidobacteriaceae bacterium]
MNFQPFFPLWLMIPLSFLVLFGLIFIFIKSYQIKRDFVATDAKIYDWLRRAIILVFVLLIIWGPSFQVGENLEPRVQNNVLFVVDRTGSMNAEDFSDNKTRLDGAKEDMKKIISLYNDAQFGLISFDSVAQTQVPFTYDSIGVTSYIDALTPQITKYSQGSKINISVSEISDDLRQAKNSNSRSKNYIYFLSDGENNVGDNYTNPDLAIFQGLQGVVDGGAVVGYGSMQGAKIKPYNFNSQSDRVGQNQNVEISQFLKDPKTGQDAISKINPLVLENIAKILNLQYIYSDGQINVVSFLQKPDSDNLSLFQRGVTPIIHPVIWPFEIIIGILVLWEFYHFFRIRVDTREIWFK